VTEFDFAALRRFPDVEAPNLVAVDATDRLLLDVAAPSLAALEPGELVVVGDHYGALTLGAAARFGCTGIRVHQDLVTGGLALAGNAARTGLGGSYRPMPLDPELFTGARLVLIQAPKSVAGLAEVVQLIGAAAPPEVEVHVGGRIKYLTRALNDVLAGTFAQVRPSLARQKSRVLSASGLLQEPQRASPQTAGTHTGQYPRREWHEDHQLWVCAHGGAFAGTRIDVGTRRLIAVLDQLPEADTAVDLGCGTGVLAVLLARQGRSVLACDQSAAAVASTRATAHANGLDGAIRVSQDDALSAEPAASADLIVCNPPFHLGGAVHAGAARTLFAGAARALRPGGELWTVFNSHLGHARTLTELVGPTRVVHRDPKFTVTATVRSGPG
jgi:16S rRNA (guanine1207-N2)-methyltransferase